LCQTCLTLQGELIVTVFFFIKKLISQFLYPLPCALILMTLGLLLLFFTCRQTLGKFLTLMALCLLLIFSYRPTTMWFLSYLERQSTPLLTDTSASTPAGLPETTWILVLASGHTIDASLPPTSQLSLQSLGRLIEAVRLHRLLPKSKLLFSGGALINGRANGEIMAAAARDLGVAEEAVVVGPQALDTFQEASRLHQTLGNTPFILVTSAAHMPRSIALFTTLGMQPVPSPTAYVVKDVEQEDRVQPSPGMFFPQAHFLDAATRGIHEYLGILWAKLRGFI
jgi:uncharacterized SAM-binding protein YcdF (DUF218 family)